MLVKSLRAVAHPYVCIAQEEELVVVQSDSRQLWLLSSTSDGVDPAPVRLLTNTLSSERISAQTLPSSNSLNLIKHLTAELMLTEERKCSSRCRDCYVCSKTRAADLIYRIKPYCCSRVITNIKRKKSYPKSFSYSSVVGNVF